MLKFIAAKVLVFVILFQSAWGNAEIKNLILSEGVELSYAEKQELFQKSKDHITKKLEQKIKEAQGESLEQSISRLNKELDREFYKNTIKLARFLKNKTSKEVRKNLLGKIGKIKKLVNTSADELERIETILNDKSIDLKETLSNKISFQNHQNKKEKLFIQIKKSGSYSEYLRKISHTMNKGYVFKSLETSRGRSIAQAVDALSLTAFWVVIFLLAIGAAILAIYLGAVGLLAGGVGLVVAFGLLLIADQMVWFT